MSYLKIIIVLMLAGFVRVEAKSSAQAKQFVTEVFTLADVQINYDRPWDIIVNDEGFYNRLLRDRALGLGEAYVEGWWDCEAVDQCIFHILRADLEKNVKPSKAVLWEVIKVHLFNHYDRSLINEHYELGDQLFKNMLDETMTYSCGYWANAKNLNEAQIAKYDLIAKKLGFKEGMRVLDIGCGWGGFAKYVAENYGVEVVAITLSKPQAAYAKEVCRGLPVEVRVQDFFELEEVFDRIVEIGMFEHVGNKNYRTFMETAYNCLVEDGMMMLHTIGSNASTVTGDPWIDKYVFPGGHIPSIAQIGTSIERLFVMEDWHNFSTDYDKTLMAWFQNFHNNWDKIKDSYSPEFYRMWKYYLLCCAGSFRARYIQLWQVVLSKDGLLGGYRRPV